MASHRTADACSSVESDMVLLLVVEEPRMQPTGLRGKDSRIRLCRTPRGWGTVIQAPIPAMRHNPSFGIMTVMPISA